MKLRDCTYLASWYIHLSSKFRLEEKVSDMETSDQVLRQQALLSNSSGKLSGRLPHNTPVSILIYVVLQD